MRNSFLQLSLDSFLVVLLSQRVLQGLFPVNTGVTGVTDEVIQGLQVRVTGNTEIQGVTWWAIIQGFGALQPGPCRGYTFGVTGNTDAVIQGLHEVYSR